MGDQGAIAEAALAKAKRSRQPRVEVQGAEYSIAYKDGGPAIPRDRVLLIELCFALGRMLEPNASFHDDPNTRAYVPEAFDFVLKALQTGELLAERLSDRTVIPWQSWPMPKSLEASAAFCSDFYHPFITSNFQCVGQVGETPVLMIDEALTWLSGLDLEAVRVPEDVERYSTQEELETWFREVRLPELERMPPADLPKYNQLVKEIASRDSIPHGEKRKRARQIYRDARPSDTRPRGRPKRY